MTMISWKLVIWTCVGLSDVVGFEETYKEQTSYGWCIYRYIANQVFKVLIPKEECQDKGTNQGLKPRLPQKGGYCPKLHGLDHGSWSRPWTSGGWGSLSVFCQWRRTPSVLETSPKFTSVIHSMSHEGGPGVAFVSKKVDMFGGDITQDTMI